MVCHKSPAHELSHLWNKEKPSAAVKNVQLWNRFEHLGQPASAIDNMSLRRFIKEANVYFKHLFSFCLKMLHS